MSSQSGPLSAFGANQWLVEEIYQQYLADPESVDKAWWDFFADYSPSSEPTNGASRSASTAAAAPALPAQPVASAPAASAPTVTSPAPAAAPPAARPPAPAATPTAAPAATASVHVPLKGASARVVTNMETSLTVPTATSVRAIPAKLIIDNRLVMNNQLRRSRGGKVSFTHIIGYAVAQAVKAMPEMNYAYAEVDGKPALVKNAEVNLGLAIDLAKPDGTRQLLVPCIKHADAMDFAQFVAAYEDIVRKARGGKLGADDFAGTTISLTNPGTIGTVHSVPRLMSGQGCIVGVGAMEYPAEFAGASAETIAGLGVSKIVTLTSTYDHRIIQGAQSGDFLRIVQELLLGADGFYDNIFRSLRIPYEPVRWVQDMASSRDDQIGKPARIIELIHSYRVRGHLMADTNPLEFEMRRHADLDIVNHGLSLWDLDREFATGGFGGKPTMSLRDILGVLRDSYCRTVGVEYMHIQDPEQRKWIQDRIERQHTGPTHDQQLAILARLNAAEAFETFLQTKYVGQKRFSLEGAETLIPLMDAIIASAAISGLDEVVIGMPHRGRLNVLANIVGKSYNQIFREFEGNIDPKSTLGSGDVKYHLGAEGIYKAPDGSAVNVSLASNPSHLEAVDPVLEGIVRAKQDVINKGEAGFTVLPLMLHGDAAFAGQGVVAETLNMSQLTGYRTGGTVHVVVNNQVGFTTNPTASRSSVYSTDVARMIQAPIFHVNGDDPEACVRVARLAFEFRQAFKKDVVIDLVCYRRRGHNEGDDPSMTQPLMYNLIEAKRSTRKLYTEALIGRGDITIDDAEEALRDYREKLEKAFAETRDSVATPHEPTSGDNSPDVVGTAISAEVVKRIADAHVNLPEGFTVHPRVLPQLERRVAMITDGSIDWAMGELLAFGSLLLEGRPVRLAGQDSRRGTFVQRHAVVTDRLTGATYTPLSNLDADQGTFHVYDSLLSEYAAMGFEYGYSVARPDALVLWEAQFGDFANGAQTIVDEFISSGEQKWGQRSGVVLLLPHGYEGQGPDHSSGRIERFLTMCAQDNMTVAMPSTPASYFHLLRWHAKSKHARPLIVFTPKSMLRNKAATSTAADLTDSTWRPVLTDSAPIDASAVRRVLLCSGKVFYDLDHARKERGITDTAIVRVEQIAPLAADAINEALAAYPAHAELAWVQEEPANMGAWPFIALNLPEHLGGRSLTRVSRPASSSPAAGSSKRSDAELVVLLDMAFPA